MSQFSSSTKPLLSFATTTILEKLVAAYGDRLTELTQREKYQLAAAITIHLWGCAEDIEMPNPDGYDDGADDTLVTTSETYLPFGVTEPVRKAIEILKHEEPDHLASILPAITSYAKEDTRLHP